MIHRVQALLGLPRVQQDRGRLAALSHRERGPDLRMQSIRPRRLHQDVSTMGIARFRNGAASFARATGMFARNKPEIRHELARRRKSPPIDKLRGEDHRAVHLEPSEALQGRDRRRIGGGQREFRDVRIQRVPPRKFVFEQREVLAEHQPIFRGER